MLFQRDLLIIGCDVVEGFGFIDDGVGVGVGGVGGRTDQGEAAGWAGYGFVDVVLLCV